MEKVERTADVGGTYGSAARNRDELPIGRTLEGWFKTRSTKVNWESPSDMETVKSEEVRPVELGSNDKGPSGKPPVRRSAPRPMGRLRFQYR